MRRSLLLLALLLCPIHAWGFDHPLKGGPHQWPSDLFQSDEFAARATALLGPDRYRELPDFFGINDELESIDGRWLFGSGCIKGACTISEAFVIVDTKGPYLAISLFDNGTLHVWESDRKTAPDGKALSALQTWSGRLAKEANGKMKFVNESPAAPSPSSGPPAEKQAAQSGGADNRGGYQSQSPLKWAANQTNDPMTDRNSSRLTTQFSASGARFQLEWQCEEDSASLRVAVFDKKYDTNLQRISSLGGQPSYVIHYTDRVDGETARERTYLVEKFINQLSIYFMRAEALRSNPMAQSGGTFIGNSVSRLTNAQRYLVAVPLAGGARPVIDVNPQDPTVQAFLKDCR